jgi:hypothetical protein
MVHQHLVMADSIVDVEKKTTVNSKQKEEGHLLFSIRLKEKKGSLLPSTPFLFGLALFR